MVRSLHKTNIIFGVLATALTTILVGSSSVSADQNVRFNVNLTEVLTVSLTEPTSWAVGDVDELLRNKVTVSALTNNYYGATVSMYADYKDLRNIYTYSSSDATSYIDTLDKSTYTHGTFPVNAWGYSLNDTDAGVKSSNYYPVTLVANPVTVIDRVQATSGTTYSRDVFFGAKANEEKQSGTYAQTVNFVAVTGVIDTDNPVVPVNPSEDNTQNEIAVYTPSTNRTTYTTRSNNTTANTTTTTTQVTPGNTVSSYANAAGVTSSSSSIVPILAAVAGVTAVSGTFFFILAKRRDDDDEEEEE